MATLKRSLQDGSSRKPGVATIFSKGAYDHTSHILVEVRDGFYRWNDLLRRESDLRDLKENLMDEKEFRELHGDALTDRVLLHTSQMFDCPFWMREHVACYENAEIAYEISRNLDLDRGNLAMP